jgi:hypothetical protein
MLSPAVAGLNVYAVARFATKHGLELGALSSFN